jgi:hypothetical protein
MGIPDLYERHYECATWPIVKRRSAGTRAIFRHSAFSRATHGQLFKRYSADIVTETFKHSVQTTTKTSMFVDKHVE